MNFVEIWKDTEVNTVVRTTETGGKNCAAIQSNIDLFAGIGDFLAARYSVCVGGVCFAG